MGEGIVEKLKQEFDLDVAWRGIEIHPETPSTGRPLAELFPADQIAAMMQHLRIAGAPFGITFTDRSFLSSSRLALQAAEFAREHGSFSRFHSALFSAYFSLGLDIGDPDVVRQIAEDAGLNAGAMFEAVQSGRYGALLEDTRREAGLIGVTGVPTFLIEEKRTIVGAQPLDVFRKTIRSL